MQKTVRRWIRFVEGYANRWWYSPLIAVLAAADSFVIVIPTDGLLVSASMLIIFWRRLQKKMYVVW
ncbi:MAG: hypothetical protein EOO01_32105 [Chitinophagaceae bacterium]|nr:MAG: hypothetical protein EOO01_32105 [Chitinophagaceae bacterium]